VEVEPDGLTFDSEAIQTERITEDADYEGINRSLFSKFHIFTANDVDRFL